MRELELKFTVDESFEPPSSWPASTGVVAVEERPPLELKAAYFDTADLRLARHGVTLRFRSGDDGGSRWTLKLPVGGGDGAEREELDFDGPSGRPPAAVRDLVRAFVRSEGLRHTVGVRTSRRRWSLLGEAGDEIAELADDRVTLVKDRRLVERFREVEIESKGMDRTALEAVAATLENAGATRAPNVSKALRALGPLAQAGPDVTFEETISPSEPAARAVERAVATAFRRLQSNDWRARLGDPEGVHQMRVGARHLRSDLKTFAPLVTKEWAESLRAELKWVGSQLGELRDLDVLTAHLRDAAEDLKDDLMMLFTELERRSDEARERALKELRSPRYDELLDRLVDAASAPSLEPAADEECSKALPPLAAKRWKRLKDQVTELAADAPQARWHEVRIRAKQARYAAEAIAPALGKKMGRQAAAFAKLCSKVQDTLGANQDAFVAIDVITEIADGHPEDARFNRAVGRLLERQEKEAMSAREAFWKAWDRVDRKKNLAWMAE